MMAGLKRSGSITSVTQEESSVDSESDTTESSYSNLTSSVLSSTDTDDKLTPSLGLISISTTAETEQHNNKKEYQIPDDKLTHSKTEKKDLGVTSASSGQASSSRKHRVRNKNLLRSVLCHPHAKLNMNNNASCSENLGVDDPNNKLSTDFSDTSSVAAVFENDIASTENQLASTSQDDEGDTNQNSNAADATSSWMPDMSSSQWHQAGCFRRYWQHYGHAMAWYQAHMNAVNRIYRDFSSLVLTRDGRYSWQWRYPNQPRQGSRKTSSVGRSNKAKHTRRMRRARNRRNSKARKATKFFCNSANEATQDLTNADGAKVEREDREEDMDLEMEITDEMLDFFKTSLKHRKERDEAKHGGSDDNEGGETHINIEEADQAVPSSAPPSERPGARRAVEMKQLYGEGAAMIHGMETALQMTFDRTQDKFQPKLWPNMPLKIVF